MRTHPIYVNICPVKDRQEVRTWWTWRRARAPRVGPTPTGLLWPRAGRPCGGSERWRREAVGSAPQSGYELSGQGGHIQKFCTFRDNLPINVVLYKHDSQKGAPDVVLIRCIQCHPVELVCDDMAIAYSMTLDAQIQNNVTTSASGVDKFPFILYEKFALDVMNSDPWAERGVLYRTRRSCRRERPSHLRSGKKKRIHLVSRYWYDMIYK